MSVKRRLFISNMLMLVMPIVLMFVAAIGLLLIYTGITGSREAPPLKFGEVFFDRMARVEKLADMRKSGMDWEQLKTEIDLFNQDNQALGLNLSLHADGSLVYPASIPPGQLGSITEMSDERVIVVTDQLSVFQVNVDAHTLVLFDTNFSLNSRSVFQNRIYLGIFMLVMLVIVVLVTNRVLMRFVFSSIMNPINILVHGVHQIRDGHLTYRIDYDKQDEFAIVCSEFNEMAKRLSIMVEDRQKDEANRRELIAGISHDLRTPLTSIKAYLEGLEKGVATTPEMERKYFETIKSKTQSLEHIINQLFLFSKLDVGEFPLHLERVQIGAELRKTITAFAQEYEPKGLVVQMTDPLSNAEVTLDIVQFRNMIQNVLENSLKYTNKERAVVHLACRDQGDDVEIALTDDGPGVAVDELEKLFDVFYRSDASRKSPHLGSGLGLAISRKVIERLGGQIRAEQAPAGGLSIIMRLPIIKQIGESNEKDIDHRG